MRYWPRILVLAATRTRWEVAALIVCLLASGTPFASSAGEPAPKRERARGESPGAAPFRDGIVLADSQFALEQGPGATRFNFAHLRDLWVRVNLAGMPPSVQLDLTLTDPRGTLVYEASAPFSSDPRVKTKDVPGAGHPVTVFQAKRMQGRLALDYAIPVSGTVVTRYLSAGTWTLVAEVGGRTFSAPLDVSAEY